MPWTITEAELESRIQERLMGPNPDKHGIFRDHNCWKCKSGEYPCMNGTPRQCEFPHARND